MPLKTPAYWRRRSFLAWMLWPVSLLFRGLVAIRSSLYRLGVLRSWQSPVPVVVIGNLTAGGAGKTPLVIALAVHLQQKGIAVGVVTRGYGGAASGGWPVLVTPESDPLQVGDEAVLIARRTGVKVVAAKDRSAAVRYLLDLGAIDVVISDDGLQHYAMQRDLELLVVDRQYQFGNGFCFPAGPLREPLSRLKQVDQIVFSGSPNDSGDSSKAGYTLVANVFYNAASGRSIEADRFASEINHSEVHAVAAIAQPWKFFASLQVLGLKLIEHPFADHSVYQASDLEFGDALPIVITEKDLVKCADWASDLVWTLQVTAEVDGIILDEFDQLLAVAQQRTFS